MKMAMALDEWVPRLTSDKEAEVEAARDALAEALGADDEAMRDRAAQLMFKSLARLDGCGVSEVLSLLQSAWFPPSPRMAEPAVRAVLSALERVDLDVAQVDDAVIVLANVCRETHTQLPAVEKALDHENAAVRQAAAGCLGRVAEDAVPLIPRLIGCASDADEGVARAALESLIMLAPFAPDDVIPVIRARAEKSSGGTRYELVAALHGALAELKHSGTKTAAAAGLVPLALDVLKDPEPSARMEAAALLGLCAPLPDAGVKTLRASLKDESPDVAACAAVALLRATGAAKDVLDVLAALLLDADVLRYEAALSALDEIEPAELSLARGVLQRAAKEAGDPVAESAKEMLAALDAHH